MLTLYNISYFACNDSFQYVLLFKSKKNELGCDPLNRQDSSNLCMIGIRISNVALVILDVHEIWPDHAHMRSHRSKYVSLTSFHAAATYMIYDVLCIKCIHIHAHISAQGIKGLRLQNFTYCPSPRHLHVQESKFAAEEPLKTHKPPAFSTPTRGR